MRPTSALITSIRILIPSFVLLAGMAACSTSNGGLNAPFLPPAVAAFKSPAVLFTQGDGVEVRNGGYGSAVARVPGKPDELYLLTDRGTNFADVSGDSLVFPVPSFSPTIGHFKVSGAGLTKLGDIKLKRPDGSPISGLPNPAGAGSTGETPITLAATALAPDAFGIDSEGLVALADGTFWVSDEYGPHVAHFAADGREIERINPYGTGTGGRKLPAVLGKRRVNRGMEGLAATSDGQWLVGIMQSAMENPNRAARNDCEVSRIVFFNLATGATKQFIYLQDNDGSSNSEICCIPGSNTDFIVIERDGKFATHATDPSSEKRVYKISTVGATDVSDPADGATGRLYGGLTLEELKNTAGLATHGVVPVSKSLVLDLLSKNYPHDKFEGVAILDANTLIVANDDDFAVTDDGAGKMAQKVLPDGKTDNTEVYFYQTLIPLY